jgi:hypothetical protein
MKKLAEKFALKSKPDAGWRTGSSRPSVALADQGLCGYLGLESRVV